MFIQTRCDKRGDNQAPTTFCHTMPTIRKRGETYQAQVRIKRHGAIVYQESASFSTQRQARTWATALEAKLERDGYEVRTTETSTLAGLLVKYTEFKQQVKPVSSGDAYSLNALAAAPFASIPLASIQPRDIASWAMSLSGHIHPSTILRHLMVLRSVFRTALPIFGIHLNLAVVSSAMVELGRVRVTAKSTSRARRISDTELEMIIAYLQTHKAGVPTDTYVALAVALPRRREELLTALWSNYDKDAKVLKLVDTKHPTERRTELVPVPPKAQAILEKLPRIDERILPYNPQSVSSAFQCAVRALGLVDIRLHDLRHEGISRLFEAGLDIPRVALISGHTSWSSLKRYTHITAANVLERL